MRGTDRQLTRTQNVALLAAGFAVSQGALFVVQSWLVAHDNVALVGLFGSLFTFATLALSVIDWGGIVVLARHELADVEEARSSFFWSLSAVRAAVAAALCGVPAAAYVFEPTGFAGAYGLAAIPGLLLGSVNVAGLLDGAHRSGVSGAIATLPALVSALTLIFVPGQAASTQGLMLGMAFSVGSALSLVLQVRALQRLRRLPHFERPTAASLVAAGRQGGLVLLTLLPSYVSYRIQVAIAVWLLGAEPTGLFIYAKQIVNGIQQGIGFVRRAEFPRLVAALQDRVGLLLVLRLQMAAVVAGLAASIMLVAVGLTVGSLRDDHLGTAGILLVWFAPTVITAAVYGAISQACVAANRAGTAATVTNLNLLFLAGATAAAAASGGTIGFAVAECLVNLLGIAALAALWRGKGKPH